MMTESHEGVSTFLGIRLGYIPQISRLYLAKLQSHQRKLTSLEIQKLPALNFLHCPARFRRFRCRISVRPYSFANIPTSMYLLHIFAQLHDDLARRHETTLLLLNPQISPGDQLSGMKRTRCNEPQVLTARSKDAHM